MAVPLGAPQGTHAGSSVGPRLGSTDDGGLYGRFQSSAGWREEEEACADLYESVATERRWILAEPPVNRTGLAAHLRRLTDGEDADLLVAEADGVIVGWISLTFEDAATVTLGMGVAEPWRGRGVGTALVTSAIEWAKSAGAERMRLEVFTHNDRAYRAVSADGLSG